MDAEEFEKIAGMLGVADKKTIKEYIKDNPKDEYDDVDCIMVYRMYDRKKSSSAKWSVCCYGSTCGKTTKRYKMTPNTRG